MYRIYWDATLPSPPLLTNWEMVTDIQGCDARVLSTNRLPELSASLSNLLIPNIWIGQPVSAERYALATYDATALKNQLLAIQSLLSRRDQLSISTLETASKDAHTAILAYGWLHQGLIEVTFSAQAPQGYTNHLENTVLNSPLVLSSLESHGYLSKERVQDVYLCSHCASALLLVKGVCESCGDSNIIHEPTYKHMKCGYEAQSQAFVLRKKGHQCPKCHETVETSVLEKGYLSTCATCQAITVDEQIGAWCYACEKETRLSQTKPRSLSSYRLTQKAIDSLLMEGKQEIEKESWKPSSRQLSADQWQTLIGKLFELSRTGLLATTVVQMSYLSADPDEAVQAMNQYASFVARYLRKTDWLYLAQEQVMLVLTGITKPEAEQLLNRWEGLMSNTRGGTGLFSAYNRTVMDIQHEDILSHSTEATSTRASDALYGNQASLDER